MHRRSFMARVKEQREYEILDAARRLLAERGYDELTMDDLAGAVGISKPTLYQHFKSKDDLIAHVVMSAMTTLEQHLHEATDADPIQQIEMAITFLLQRRYGAGSPFTGINTMNIMRTLHTHPLLADCKQRLMAGLRALVDHSKTRGEVVSDIPTDVIVRSLFCLLGAAADPQGYLLMQESDLDSAIQGIVRLFMRGITGRGTEITQRENES
jgi:AcrR family transcriptional regulator